MRLGIFSTHPIQYFAPLWRALAATPQLDVMVHYFSDHSVAGRVDKGFGVKVAWDVPLLQGYDHCFLSRTADLDRPASVRIKAPRRLLSSGRFDAVLVNGYTHAFERQVVAVGRRLHIRTVLRGELSDQTTVSGRGSIKSLARDLYLSWFYSYIDSFCCIGTEARRHLERRGISRERLFFSPYSVDTEVIKAQKKTLERHTARAELGIAENSVVILFSGKLIPRKAPLLLIDSLRTLGDSARQVHLVFVGEGELRRSVEDRGSDLLGPRLSLAGFVNQSQLGKYFLAADVFVLPSLHETWGLVVNEAMQFGLPVVVSTGVGCRKDLVVEGETGFTFPSGDAQGLADVLRTLVGNADLRRRMGGAAARHIESYSVEASARGIRAAIGLSEETERRP